MLGELNCCRSCDSFAILNTSLRCWYNPNPVRRNWLCPVWSVAVAPSGLTGRWRSCSVQNACKREVYTSITASACGWRLYSYSEESCKHQTIAKTVHHWRTTAASSSGTRGLIMSSQPWASRSLMDDAQSAQKIKVVENLRRYGDLKAEMSYCSVCNGCRLKVKVNAYCIPKDRWETDTAGLSIIFYLFWLYFGPTFLALLKHHPRFFCCQNYRRHSDINQWGHYKSHHLLNLFRLFDLHRWHQNPTSCTIYC